MSEVIDRKLLLLANKIIGEGSVICDIGSRDANEGIALFQRLRASQLHVFEPNPEAAEMCRSNLKALTETRPGEIFFNECAVADRNETLTFYAVDSALSENKDIGFSSLMRMNPAYTKRRAQITQREIKVHAITLDTYFKNFRPPDLLWVDVEGAEMLVVGGASATLKHVKLIHIEVSFRPMQLGKPHFLGDQRAPGKTQLCIRGTSKPLVLASVSLLSPDTTEFALAI